MYQCRILSRDDGFSSATHTFRHRSVCREMEDGHMQMMLRTRELLHTGCCLADAVFAEDLEDLRGDALEHVGEAEVGRVGAVGCGDVLVAEEVV